MKLVLASTSRYRQALLGRLGMPFETVAPEVDESRKNNESAESLALRLAEAKARAVTARFPEALIIGSDQVCDCAGTILGKPGNHENAVRQLTLLSGKVANFHTGLCVFNTVTQRATVKLITNPVAFRELTPEAIERYLIKEQPYDCAGSAKSEGMGIALIKSLGGEDPNALIGLPLIALVDLLLEQGMEIP